MWLMTKWAAIFVLALVLPMVLMACGSGEPSASPNAERAASTSTPEGAAATPKPTAAAPESTTGTTPESMPAPDRTPAETDREALVALYDATDGDNWSNNANWLSDKALGEWSGVTTDSEGRVTDLDLDFRDLRGEIPPELGNLMNLMVLELQDNDLSGEIPPELGGLANLRVLALGNNDLTGEIPGELGSLSNLTGLALQGNELEGDIPIELAGLANLKFLLLSDNGLSGCVPSGLRERLDMDVSKLGDVEFCSDGATTKSIEPTPAVDRTVSAPTEETTAPWLYRIEADAIVRISVSHMGKTVEYESTEGGWVIKDGSDTPVYEEQWAGTPLLLSSARSTLVSPNIDDLGAYGLAAPQTMVTLTDGSGARLSYTLGDPTPDGHSWYAALNGDDGLHTLPSIWGELVSRLATAPPYPPPTPESMPAPDRAPAETDREALAALYNATDGPNWRVFQFQENNWLSGDPIGEWYGVTTDDDGRVTKLELFGFGLNGEIPSELASLANLMVLELGNSLLSGEIPPELADLANLEILNLSGNDWEDSELTGAIPPELGRLSNLTQLYLFGNRLSGDIPAELGNLANLQTLRLERNQLSGEIPAELGNLANLQEMYLFGNQLSGCVPEALRRVEDNDLDGLGLAAC